ncbi:TRAP transporter large permease subunit [Mameliella sediminis]|uniref:TRAP transporter large permease subunit n=1 Tax=Mameliella sediminis TaxID=2836866 RepID=UPI001C48FDF8|nr:TRAP transporter large permease subunit [Mameliella sediminis]MBV7396939.1 TRAP transporter large permease subunit [Mameliella sediminis]MBY6116102.1 TRAP transporter large permease subunit [Antarctobacter heliothermus]MBY6146067.1 TRAP transporter large permease subunit [Mameliella alba]MCA0955252.1 TRAP transporter large permease subunit [Mameliella alba]
MTQDIDKAIAATDIEIAAQDPLHEDLDIGFEDYTPVDHFSHVVGIGISGFYLVAALATLYEVFSRYVLHAPTFWAFETVMVTVAAAWMLSAGYVTLKKRHIAITVIHGLTTRRQQWWLDLFAMLVGIFALYMLLTDAPIRAYVSVERVEKSGSAFNSPLPLMMKSLMVIGAFMYLAQLMVNLHRHLSSGWAKWLVKIVAAYFVLYFVSAFLSEVLDWSVANAFSGFITDIGKALDPSKALQMRKMDLGTVSLIMVIMLVALMMTGMPLGIVTLIVSVIMAIGFFGPRGLFLVSSNAVGLLEHYSLVAVPFFVLMASILERAGIAEDLFDAMSIFAGNLRGGVAVQTTVVAVILAAMSGVMGGEIVMLGLVALPQMFRLGYDRKITIGLICAAGALATLIPPSIIMIVYGLSAEVGIGDLFMAGAIPGIMLAVFYASYVLIRVNLNPALAPTAAEVAQMTGKDQKLSRERLTAVLLCILLIGAVMGSIYGGIASVTEAAAVGCIGAMFVAAVRNQFKWDVVSAALMGTMTTVGTIIWLVLGAVSFVGIFNLVGGGEFMRSLFLDLGLSALGTVLVMMLILMVLGTFMEWIAIVLITVPVFAPVVMTLAPDLGLTEDQAKIWFGILFVMNIQIYFLSPPFGPACFWLKSVAPKDVTLQEIFLSVLPFIGLQIVGLLLVMFFPQIALWLPELLN